jgi:hypothetical protein
LRRPTDANGRFDAGEAAVSSPAATSLACPSCGAATVAGDRFCEACGADLPVTEGPATPIAEAEPEYGADTADLAPPGPPCVSCGADATEILDGYCGVCGMKQPAPRDHIEVAYQGVAAVTDRGRKHHRNEDAFALRVEEGKPVIAIVCDGVSTTVDPDLASQAAADTALGVLTSADGAADADITAAHAAAQTAVLGVSDVAPPPDLGWPSCTFLASVIDGGVVHLGTLGDCG